eukprot:7747998-Pyramimonas_sp.AAC.1
MSLARCSGCAWISSWGLKRLGASCGRGRLGASRDRLGPRAPRGLFGPRARRPIGVDWAMS